MSLSPTHLDGEEAARVGMGAKRCVCWLPICQDEKNIELILQLQQGKLFLSISCHTPLPMVSTKLKGILSFFSSGSSLVLLGKGVQIHQMGADRQVDSTTKSMIA